MLRIFANAVLMATTLSAISAPSVEQQTARFSSGDLQVSVIELYTSEGCSSCPPADRWLSSLKGHPQLWRDFVPLAFHVDYWDYIGWRDRYARADFGDRQRQYAREGGVNTVYTPGMFKDGHEWRGWRRGRAIGATGVNVGNLLIEVTNNHVLATFDTIAGNEEELNVNVALLGMNLRSSVSAGENRGEILLHDFTVLGIDSTKLEWDGNLFAGGLQVPHAVEAANRYAIVAWVSSVDRLAPIQSAGGYIDGLQLRAGAGFDEADD